MTDVWNPEQYDRFRAERRQPFQDLLALVKPHPGMRVLDLGCGTGEPTRDLHRELGARETLGVDNSPAMLERAQAFAEPGLRFVAGDIGGPDLPEGPFDLVFSNAALHWVPDHPGLLRRLFALLGPQGQLAVQMPANHGHASQRVAAEVAASSPFREALDGFLPRTPVLEPEDYALLLHSLGFPAPHVHLRAYLHLLDEPQDVVEWVKGTTLTVYERRLPKELYPAFLERYRTRLLEVLPDQRPFPFSFRRVFLHGSL